jgi:predicted RNase H-like nuclease (RuvC/YqgF family)
MSFDAFQKIVERNDAIIRQLQAEIIRIRDHTDVTIYAESKIDQLHFRIKSLTNEITEARRRYI